MTSIRFVFIAALFLCGCGGYTSGTIQKSEMSYLVFRGPLAGAEFTVDNGTRIALNPEVDRYRVSPGKHELRVYRGDRTVVERVIVLDAGATMEIRIP